MSSEEHSLTGDGLDLGRLDLESLEIKTLMEFPPALRQGRSLFGSCCVLAQERVRPRSDLGMLP
jgi:hypothetical protein